MKAKILCLIAVIAMMFTVVADASLILWEDFSDEDGNGAFDPAFVHTMAGNVEGSDPQYFFSEFSDHQPILAIFETTDYVTFNLENWQYVSHISLQAHSPSEESRTTITFVGSDDNLIYVHENFSWETWITYEADISEIGVIQAVQLSAYPGGAFDDIILTVMPVPEPTTWMLFVLGVAVTGVFSTKGRRDRKDLFRVFRS